MKQFIGAISLVVPNYDEAIEFYVEKLGFNLLQDTPLSSTKRWVIVKPKGGEGSGLLLSKADDQSQIEIIGSQAGGRVFLFLNTDDFDRDYANYKAAGVLFLEEPRKEPYGTVAVFQDPFGNKWDLIEAIS